MIDYLEKAFIHQEDKKYRLGYELKLPFRRLLEGFDFAELKATGKGWIDFVQKAGAVTLFGRDFGDMIFLTSEPCESWRRLSTGQDYLAVCVQDLNSIVDKFGIRGQGDTQVVKGIYWHMPDKIFEDCACQDRTYVPCDRVQVLLPVNFKWHRITKSVVPPKSLDYREEGAVIFGNSKKLHVNWPYNPEEIPEARPMPESANSDETQVELEHTVSSASSETQGSVSSTPLTSSQLGAGIAADDPESLISTDSFSKEKS
jgi:hypothetical protein